MDPDKKKGVMGIGKQEDLIAVTRAKPKL